MKVPFLDLKVTDINQRNRMCARINQIFDHGKFIMGPEVDEFERRIAEYCGRQYCISVGSGTDALYFALRVIGIGSGDDVITTSLSWIATANAIVMTGANPVFADIKEDLNICPNSVTQLITKKTKAILVVDYTGMICDMEELQQIADHHNIHLVEDGSQAFGAQYKSKRCGSFGIVSAISHNPMKVFAACGEAGSILCDDPLIYKRLITLRYNGTVNREICVEPSFNGRMDTIQAAILLEKLKDFDQLISKRRENAMFYDEKIVQYAMIPKKLEDRNHVYYTYTIRSSKRDDLKKYLEKKGIETKIQHPVLMPKQPAYINKYIASCENAEKIKSEILCLPINEGITRKQKEYVSESIKGFGPSIPES